ncbi:glycosyltransferase [Ammoniphilus sp. 3BR4]|uniref:glycosyltransferase n=1 Tax=Ammoniphilus sp. 3BR4 TaxID=3158265 RepID=UPI00346707FD
MKHLKLLILVKPFGKLYPKHRPKYDFLEAIAKFSYVKFWHQDGDIRTILRRLNFKPDFIYHFDVGYNYSLSPKITGLNLVDIPKGTYIYDEHWNPASRIRYLQNNKIDIIFSPNKSTFLRRYPKFKPKFRFLPYSINPHVMKDWQLPKDRDFMLIGSSPKEWYPFRNEVYKRMRDVEGFEFLPHPGHKSPPSKNLMVNGKYAQELNRAKIYFTCGSKFQYPLAKFFEVPACGTLLLAEPNQDIFDLGFKDGVHFVACNKTDFYEKAMYYLENEEERNEIVKNGHDFVHAYHTHEVRAKQFLKYIDDFLKMVYKAPRTSPPTKPARKVNARHWNPSQPKETSSKNVHMFRVDDRKH